MIEMNYSKFLGKLYQEFVATSVTIRQELETLEEVIAESENHDNPTKLRLATELVFDEAINNRQEELEALEDASSCIEDIIDGKASCKVERLVKAYFDKIKERFELDPKKFGAAIRILKAEIRDIEAELEAEGYPIFGGYICYENMMLAEDEEEGQNSFDSDNPFDEEKESKE